MPTTTVPPVVPPVTPPPVVPGGTYTAYNPAPGTDPDWDAFLAMYQAKIANTNAEATKNKAMLQSEYDAGLARLNLAQPGARTQTEAGLLARGVGRSSEAQAKRTDLEAQYIDQQTAADRARINGMSTIDSGVTTSLLDLAAQREAQIAASRARLKGKAPNPDTPGYDDPTKPAGTTTPKKKPATGTGTGGGGNGGGGGGAVVPKPPVTVPIFKRPGKKVI